MSENAELELAAQIAEQMRQRIYGKYRGVVQDIDDPDQIGRIRASVPAVFGESLTNWAMPCTPFAGPAHGLVLLPEPGDGVWIEFEGGDLSRPIWSGCWWSPNERPQDADNELRLLETSQGHAISIHDGSDQIKLKRSGGGEILLSGDGISIRYGNCTIEMKNDEIDINNGMVLIGQTKVSLAQGIFEAGM